MAFALTIVICAIDFTEKNDDFAENNAPKEAIIVDYYLNMALYLLNVASPLFVFLSTIFMTTRLASHTEIIAMLSNGVSYSRVLRMYLWGALLLALFTFLNVGYILPKANAKRIEFELTYIKNKTLTHRSHAYFYVNDSTYAYVGSYSIKDQRGYSLFTLETFNDAHELVSRLEANSIDWNPEKESWKLSSYKIRSFRNGIETIKKYPSKDTVLNLYPKDFEDQYNTEQTFTLSELLTKAEDLKRRGLEGALTCTIEYYERITYPFAIILLTLIGVIVSSRKSREGIAQQLILGVILAFSYFIFLQLGRGFVNDGSIHPLLGAWIPNIIFGGIGFLMYKQLPK